MPPREATTFSPYRIGLLVSLRLPARITDVRPRYLPQDGRLGAAGYYCGGRTMAYKVSGVSGISIAFRMEYNWLSWTPTELSLKVSR